MELTILPNNVRIETDGKEHVLSLLRGGGVFIRSDCSGSGRCGKCRVKVETGCFREPDEAEKSILGRKELDEGVRLACCLYPLCDGAVSIIPEKLETEWKNKLIRLPDWFSEALSGESRPVKISVSAPYGISFDIGTTSVAAMLWDCRSGTLFGSKSMLNPQSVFGADVISRIFFAQQDRSNLKLLQDEIVSGLNGLTAALLGELGIAKEQVTAAVAVGNTTMSHLLLGVDPSSLAKSPFLPVFTDARTIGAEQLGLSINPCGEVYVAANIAGHVGSDLTAGIIATRLHETSGLNILIDVGTNGEIIMERDGALAACSTAAGPAFEGACITHGMRAEAGAIEKAELLEGDIRVETIGNEPAAGICGSGLIDVLASMLDCGAIDYKGKIAAQDEPGISEKIRKRIRRNGKTKEFVLVYGSDTRGGRDIVITQMDIRQVQMAKGAICAGIKIMLSRLGSRIEEVDNLMVSGAFGSYIDIASALRIGLFPGIDIRKIKSVGNTAGIGASMLLLSAGQRLLSEQTARRVRHVELSVSEEFQTEYMQSMPFPKA